MSERIILTAKRKNGRRIAKSCTTGKSVVKKSLVKVYFSSRNLNLPYYNDRFDLKKGDYVYVSGKLYGLLGVVTEVNYCFKIKLSDYERVTCVIDTKVKGEFYNIGTDFVTFDPSALPYKKVLSWLKPPELSDCEYVCGSESKSFLLEDLSKMKLDSDEADKAKYCFENGRVKYLSVCGTTGRALVAGSKVYEIEFKLKDSVITNLFCSCYETDYCGHSAAVMLKLRKMLDCIENNFKDEYEKSGCFCTVDKNLLLQFSVGAKETGKIVL
ncbi:MAG: SWIM zinc finger domain-containing protein [Acutalibacteraceae bacterium]